VGQRLLGSSVFRPPRITRVLRHSSPNFNNLDTTMTALEAPIEVQVMAFPSFNAKG